MIKQIINQKMSQLTPNTLMQMGSQYGIHLTQKNAQKIIAIIKSSDMDIFDDQKRAILLQKIATQVSPKTAQEIQTLMNQFL